MVTTTLCDQVIDVIEEYLGPAAERFIKRQVSFHLKKKPEELSKHDLPQLSEWVKVSLALLTEDKAMVDKCEREIRALGN
jgi:hypothetical protein